MSNFTALFRRLFGMQKQQIVNMLAARCGYKSYLEICTYTTGLTYSRIDRAQFSCCKRLMYRVPEGYSDNEPIDYSTESESSEELLRGILESGERFDIVFVDPFHTYEDSRRDIEIAIRLIIEKGAVVVHDCNPPNEKSSSGHYIPGEWCGLTYAAFLDVVLNRNDIRYFTVDADYGCGIITGLDLPGITDPEQNDTGLTERWKTLEPTERYGFFDRHRTELLRLVSFHNFRNRLMSRQ